MRDYDSPPKDAAPRGRLVGLVTGALLVAGLLALPAASASADPALQGGSIDGGTGNGVSVGIEWAETEYDTELGWTVHVSVNGPATGYTSPYYFRAVVFTDGSGGGSADVGTDGGDRTITGTIRSYALEQDAHLRVRVFALNSYGYDTHILYEQDFDLGYIDHPANLGIQADDWEVSADGIWWTVTIDWDSVAGAEDEVCSDWAQSCRGALYAETADGHRYVMRYHVGGYDYTDIGAPRTGSGERQLTNTGGQPLVARDYVAVYWRLAATALNGDDVILESPHVPVSVPDDFVYVALGDSYQSGEGAGNSITNTNLYRTTAYENGSNFLPQWGSPENTYSSLLSGNGCHRALNNYAKVNAELLEPGAEVTLFDVTCSGANIQPGGGKPPIVGTVGSGVSSNSQVAQAMARLDAAGIDPADVDLVTVGMGGNDAGFGAIIEACVIPNLLRRLLDAYPDSPGEVEFLAGLVASCSNYDRFISKTDPDIDALQAKEEWAQQELLLAFPNARILQVNYPNILPVGASAPAWCGGIRREDLDFARSKVVKIENEISASVTATGSPRLQLVDLESAFGSNALCPGGSQSALANGIPEANLDAELTRLLNLNGDGDAVARDKLDVLVREYRDVRACAGNKLNPFDGDCDMDKETGEVSEAANDLMEYMGDDARLNTIFANVMAPPGPGAEPEDVRFDRTRGLFHPNADGHAVAACNVLASYQGQLPDGCYGAAAEEQVSTVNGIPFWLAPIIAHIEEWLSITVNGYAPGSTVQVTFHSEKADLGEFTADANGQVDFTVQVPDVPPGVHLLQISGVGAGGVQVVNEVKVEIPGDPVPGESYGVYLAGFDAGNPAEGIIEYVDVTYLGTSFTAAADAQGGVFLELPVPDNSGEVSVTAVSQLTGESAEKTLVVDNPDDLTVAAWGGSVDAPPAWNRSKAGQTETVSFRVLDGQGRPVKDPSVIDLRTYAIDCASGADLGPVAPAADAGHSGLRYQGSGWWKFNWKAEKALAGTCRTFSVVIDNGGRHDAWFDFRSDSSGGGVHTHWVKCLGGGFHDQVASPANADHSDWRFQGNGWWKYTGKSDPAFAGTCKALSVVLHHGGRHILWYHFR